LSPTRQGIGCSPLNALSAGTKHAYVQRFKILAGDNTRLRPWQSSKNYLLIRKLFLPELDFNWQRFVLMNNPLHDEMHGCLIQIAKDLGIEGLLGNFVMFGSVED
jgi:hypothetical protein